MDAEFAIRTRKLSGMVGFSCIRVGCDLNPKAACDADSLGLDRQGQYKVFFIIRSGLGFPGPPVSKRKAEPKLCVFQ